MNKRGYLCLLAVSFLLLGGCSSSEPQFVIASETESESTEQTTEVLPVVADEETEKTKKDVTKEEDNKTILIYICGEVKKPGVYELPKGSRICDAVEIAGGMTKLASPNFWNLAEFLSDGQMLFFPTKEEADAQKKAIEDLKVSSGQDAKVRINSAEQSELETIPGVGPSRAKAILTYRREHGNFKSAEELMNISGIGEALFDRMRDYIVID